MSLPQATCPAQSTSRCRVSSRRGRERCWASPRTPVLIADTPEQLSEARLRLARVGIEDVTGYLEGGVDGWKQAGFALAADCRR